MKTTNSVSIAIPTLNEEVNIKKCLKSIFKQKFAGKLEVFVIDGGSNDKTIEVAKEFKAKVLINPLTDAESGKMIGLRNSTSTYFMILDADMELEGFDWFNKMIRPLVDDSNIAASFTKFVIHKSDNFLSHFIAIDPIQRDPLFRYLTPGPKELVIKKKKDYWICKYSENKIVPAGFCLYRRNQLIKLNLDKRHKFMELDTLTLFVRSGLKSFAYVPSAGIHHPFLKSLKMLIKKRIRNLNTQYFNQPDERQFTWINFSNKRDFLKIILWVIYANSIILPSITGLYRSIKYKDLVALYEPIFVWITTNLIIIVFIRSKEGRSYIKKALVGG